MDTSIMEEQKKINLNVLELQNLATNNRDNQLRQTPLTLGDCKLSLELVSAENVKSQHRAGSLQI